MDPTRVIRAPQGRYMDPVRLIWVGCCMDMGPKRFFIHGPHKRHTGATRVLHGPRKAYIGRVLHGPHKDYIYTPLALHPSLGAK